MVFAITCQVFELRCASFPSSQLNTSRSSLPLGTRSENGRSEQQPCGQLLFGTPLPWRCPQVPPVSSPSVRAN